MVVTEFYNGQGLGNQLWVYVVLRSIALDKGYEFGIMNPRKFKGSEFLSLDYGHNVIGGKGPEGGPPEILPDTINYYYVEKDTWYEKFKCDIRDYDENLINIKDNTKIEGYFQSEKYIIHRKNQIKNWLKINPEYDCFDFSNDNICILNIRGGEYKGNHDLILPKKYWVDAILNMKKIKDNLKFIIITDDVKYANKLLPEYPAYHFSIGKDYSIIKNAYYLIISNSSFSFFPAWTSETVKYVIAPKYWARHNISDGFWACAFNMYENWLWQDKEGNLFSFDECSLEYDNYKKQNQIISFGPRPLKKSKNFIERIFYNVLTILSKIKKKYT